MDGENNGKPYFLWMIWGYPFFWNIHIYPYNSTNLYFQEGLNLHPQVAHRWHPTRRWCAGRPRRSRQRLRWWTGQSSCHLGKVETSLRIRTALRKNQAVLLQRNDFENASLLAMRVCDFWVKSQACGEFRRGGAASSFNQEASYITTSFLRNYADS